MHVVFLEKTLYGADVATTLDKLRADPAVAFADVDARRYPHALPNDPLFVPTATASGQWYMLTPSTATPTSDAAATDAVSAWGITLGSSGTVIADIDSGIRFDHPDLLRAGFGGRLLPGYDFVGQDLNSSNSAPLGTYLVANDGDGWDPDPSDPGDWIDSTDLMNTAVFPSKNCSVENSSWHGTRVMGVLGALTNNDVGIAGMTWNPYLLPVRALGKCGGLDSDIIAGIMWSVGMTVFDESGNPVPANPYPADIINLSLGGTGGSCPSDYASLVTQLAGMGVLVVASAGNESGPVDIPGNCPGVLAVAGLRNVGTKVGYSSLGPEVGIGAPAGNCVNTTAGAPCLRSIDTTVNEGLTVPGASGYTDQTNSNLGTSFSAPIVSGIAALMRAANANLTPPQLIARIKASATPYPQPVTTPPTPQCVNGSTSSVECACTTTTCGAGMVNAFKAVKAALNPIAAVKIPAGFTSGSGTFDAGGSAPACNATIATYAWSKSGAVVINSGMTSAQVNVTANGAGTLTLVVTDSAGNTDTAMVNISAGGAGTAAPASAGTSAARLHCAHDGHTGRAAGGRGILTGQRCGECGRGARGQLHQQQRICADTIRNHRVFACGPDFGVADPGEHLRRRGADYQQHVEQRHAVRGEYSCQWQLRCFLQRDERLGGRLSGQHPCQRPRNWACGKQCRAGIRDTYRDRGQQQPDGRRRWRRRRWWWGRPGLDGYPAHCRRSAHRTRTCCKTNGAHRCCSGTNTPAAMKLYFAQWPIIPMRYAPRCSR